MSAQSRMARKAGVTLSTSVTAFLILVYVVQSGSLVYLLLERSRLQETLHQKDVQIMEMEREIDELRERLKIFQIIEDFQSGFTPQERDIIGEVIFTQSKRLGYDPILLLALILTESSFRKGQESYMGAQGLMQVLPSTGYWLSNKYKMPWKGDMSLFDPHYNIRMGSYYLFELILKFKNVKKALIAYNMGPEALSGRIKLKERIPEGYARAVMKQYQMLKETYPDSLFG
ncbi:MAG: transglycosylase SLT domain-containing protein [candidate division Zixibacteria bacterium]|nr:transglycosylase SLT domain-containing protein [candidate division Zixibacteria bacterium]